MADADQNTSGSTLVELAADIVAAYVSKNAVSVSDLSKLISEVHLALQNLGTPAPALQLAKPEPAVSIRKSITPDFLICLDDGMKFKSLKRHLAKLGMTPDQYRAKWSLPSDYPMVAPNYSATRSGLAKQSGLGRKAAESAPEPVAEQEPAKRGRRKAA